MAFIVGGRRGGGQRRARLVANAKVLEAMQQMQVRLQAVEMRNQRDAGAGDVSEPEAEAVEEEEPAEVTPEMRFFKSVLGSTSKTRLKVSFYIGGLNPEELIDQINDMDKSFDYEEMAEGKRVKFVVTKLKGHAVLWWDGVQAERRRLGKLPIKNWNRMVEKLRGKFFPSDYQLSLFRQMQNLRQRSLTVKEYKEEFYKVSIRVRQIQDTYEKVARYINGLGMEIQDEISVLFPQTVEETYHMVLKAEEKLMRNQSSKSRGTF